MSGSQRYRAAHKGTGRQTNDTGRRTKGIEGNRNELNAVHIQLCCGRSVCGRVQEALHRASVLYNVTQNLNIRNPVILLCPASV